MKIQSLLWWCIPVIPILGSLRQEDHEFKVRLLNETLSPKEEGKQEEWEEEENVKATQPLELYLTQQEKLQVRARQPLTS